MGNKSNMSCARVVQLKSSNIGNAERHNERHNETYSNLNVEPERIPLNYHFKDPGDESYMDILKRKEAEGIVSTRGLRSDATLFDEIVIDVNTEYFEDHGGYDFAVKFYQDAYRFIEKKFGSENVISAVMHADEINKAVTEKRGHPVYHYHMHVVVMPVVEKEIRWSSRCKDESLRGTVREVIRQISHSKKWESKEPLLDEIGCPVFRKNGKPKYKPSYSILQDEVFEYLHEAGYTDIERGKEGSTVEHLSSLQYQIGKDTERLKEIEFALGCAQSELKIFEESEPDREIIDKMQPKKAIGKNVLLPRQDYEDLKTLAEAGITAKTQVFRLSNQLKTVESRYRGACAIIERREEEIDSLQRKCKAFLYALERFPDLVKTFIQSIADRVVSIQKREKQREIERERKSRSYRDRDDWER